MPTPADRTAAKIARALNDAGQGRVPDKEVPKGARLSDFVVAPPNAKDVTPKAIAGGVPRRKPLSAEQRAELTALGSEPKNATARRYWREDIERTKAAEPDLHIDPSTGATVLSPKLAPKRKAGKAKAAAKPSAVERVPAAEVVALLTALGLTKSQLARAVGCSSSLVSEWVGAGRGQLMHRERLAAVTKAARAFANAGPK